MGERVKGEPGPGPFPPEKSSLCKVAQLSLLRKQDTPKKICFLGLHCCQGGSSRPWEEQRRACSLAMILET